MGGLVKLWNVVMMQFRMQEKVIQFNCIVLGNGYASYLRE